MTLEHMVFAARLYTWNTGKHVRIVPKKSISPVMLCVSRKECQYFIDRNDTKPYACFDAYTEFTDFMDLICYNLMSLDSEDWCFTPDVEQSVLKLWKDAEGEKNIAWFH